MNLWDKAKNFTRGGIILTDWLHGGVVAIPTAKAQERANVCIVCVHNQDSPVTEFVANAIKEQIELKDSLDLKLEDEGVLHTCQICDCALRLKVHVPMDRLRPTETELDKFPSFCWMNTEQKGLK